MKLLQFLSISVLGMVLSISVFGMGALGESTPSCVGSSSVLLRQDCEAFALWFDIESGWNWPFCSDLRSDPCGCPHVECTVVQGDVLGAGVDVLSHSKGFDFNWEAIPNSGNLLTPELYITALFLADQSHNKAPRMPTQISLFANLQLLRLFSDDVAASNCKDEDCPAVPPEQVGQVYFNLTEAEQALYNGQA